MAGPPCSGLTCSLLGAYISSSGCATLLGGEGGYCSLANPRDVCFIGQRLDCAQDVMVRQRVRHGREVVWIESGGGVTLQCEMGVEARR